MKTLRELSRMDRDEIIDRTGAQSWPEVEAEFSTDGNLLEVQQHLDAIFPTENNAFLAVAIALELGISTAYEARPAQK